MSSGHSSPSALITSYLDVDSALWLYMRKCSKYSGPLECVTGNCRVTADLDVSGQAGVPDRLIVSGDDKSEVDHAVEEIARMVEHCQQSVIVRALPAQSEAVYQKIIQHVNDVIAGAQISLSGSADIRVIGTTDEVGELVKQLRDSCGLVEGAYPMVDSQAPAAATSDVREDSRNVRIMKLETDLWKYMQKNPEFDADVRRLKEEMHVDVVEAVSGAEVSN